MPSAQWFSSLGSLTRAEVAAATGVAEPFLAKVLRTLVEVRLLHSRRGVGGGFQLSHPPEKIPMLQVIEAFEGDREEAD